MTIRAKPMTLKQQALLWLLQYENSQNADPNHPAVQAIRSLSETGALFDRNATALEDLFLQMRHLAIRSGGKSYEEALAILADSTFMSPRTVGRRIKRKPTMRPEIEALIGNDSLFKFLFHAAQVKPRPKSHKD